MEIDTKNVSYLKLENKKLRAKINAKNKELDNEKYNYEILSELYYKGIVDKENRLIKKKQFK